MYSAELDKQRARDRSLIFITCYLLMDAGKEERVAG